jgi:hypothetical protein
VDYKRSERRWRNNWHPQTFQKSKTKCEGEARKKARGTYFSVLVCVSRTGFLTSFSRYQQIFIVRYITLFYAECLPSSLLFVG